jgi:DNA-binding CsgD family transcriptional regulator
MPVTRKSPARREATLAESDVRAIVRLVGEVAASRRDHTGMKRMLMEGLCELVGAGSWIWCLGCKVEAGEQPVYVSMAHGGFDEARYASLLCASAHPDMAWISETMIREMLQRNSQVTRQREQLVERDGLSGAGIATHLQSADIGSFVVVLRPIDERSISTLGLYRRLSEPAFTERERLIAHILLSEVPWLHEHGWPEDRGTTVPRLSPRRRLVLNLLLDGRSRKEIASSLSLSEHTIAGYQKDLYGHFGVNSHAALMRRFQLGDGGDR